MIALSLATLFTSFHAQDIYSKTNPKRRNEKVFLFFFYVFVVLVIRKTSPRLWSFSLPLPVSSRPSLFPYFPKPQKVPVDWRRLFQSPSLLLAAERASPEGGAWFVVCVACWTWQKFYRPLLHNFRAYVGQSFAGNVLKLFIFLQTDSAAGYEKVLFRLVYCMPTCFSSICLREKTTYREWILVTWIHILLQRVGPQTLLWNWSPNLMGGLFRGGGKGCSEGVQ